MQGLKDLIVSLFNEVAEVPFKSKRNGKVKCVKSTASSKILHLLCPDLFIMWDANIRNGWAKMNNYGRIIGDGEDYFKFLIDMQKLWTALDETMRGLQEEYGKRATRIIDEYNLCKFRKE